MKIWSMKIWDEVMDQRSGLWELFIFTCQLWSAQVGSAIPPTPKFWWNALLGLRNVITWNPDKDKGRVCPGTNCISAASSPGTHLDVPLFVPLCSFASFVCICCIHRWPYWKYSNIKFHLHFCNWIYVLFKTQEVLILRFIITLQLYKNVFTGERSMSRPPVCTNLNHLKTLNHFLPLFGSFPNGHNNKIAACFVLEMFAGLELYLQ